MILIFLLVFFGPSLLCTGVYLLTSRAARVHAGREIEPADHINLLYAILFAFAAPFLVINTVRLPFEHAIAVVLIPGLISSAILGWQYQSSRHATMLAVATIAVAVLSVLIDPICFGPKSSEPSIGLFLLEPTLWLIGFAIISSFVASSHARSSLVRTRNECLKCGYSLEGLHADICPECGSELHSFAANAGVMTHV